MNNEFNNENLNNNEQESNAINNDEITENSEFENNVDGEQSEEKIIMQEMVGVPDAPPPRRWKKEVIEWAEAILIAVVVALLIRNFVFTIVSVQGNSMVPTLINEDKLYVNRFFYTPQKGDIVIFTPGSDPEKPYIKRVIAVEGDSLYIDPSNGDVYVNRELMNENYINSKIAPNHVGIYIEKYSQNNPYSLDNPIVIEPGYIFAMGDNRNQSQDSRNIGPIPRSEIMGQALFRIWPFDKFGLFKK